MRENPIERSKATISERELLAKCDYDNLVAFFLSKKPAYVDLEVSRLNFYGLQLLLKAVLRELGCYNVNSEARRFHNNKCIPFRGDGIDGLRVLHEIVDGFVRRSSRLPTVVRPLSSKKYDWPILIEGGANGSKSVTEIVKEFKLGSKTVLKFVSAGSRKGNSRGKVKPLATWRKALRTKIITSPEDHLCNAILKHHVDEIELYCSHDFDLIYHGDDDLKFKRDLHNQSLVKGLKTFPVSYAGGLETPCLNQEIPPFWEKWQSKSRRLKKGWSAASPKVQFGILWEKIMGEYLGSPERKPFNVLFDQQVDLRPLGFSGMMHLFLEKEKGDVSGKKPSKGSKRYIREMLADKHASKTFRGIIKRYMKRRFMALAAG